MWCLEFGLRPHGVLPRTNTLPGTHTHSYTHYWIMFPRPITQIINYQFYSLWKDQQELIPPLFFSPFHSFWSPSHHLQTLTLASCVDRVRLRSHIEKSVLSAVAAQFVCCFRPTTVRNIWPWWRKSWDQFHHICWDKPGHTHSHTYAHSYYDFILYMFLFDLFSSLYSFF